MAPLPFAFVVHGIAAVLILAVIGLGLIGALRLTARGAKKVGEKVGTSSRHQP